MSLIGKEITDFKVKAFHNGEFKDVSKEDVLGHWSVFVFYPADFTFVCPTELSDLADLYEEFQKNGTEIYSVSTDSHFVHKAWYDASDTIKRVKYPMLADPTGQLCRDFGVYIEDEGMALRGSFIINPQGRIVSYEINDNSIGRDAAELLRKVQAAQYVAEHGDQVCPAKWRPGAKTLRPGIELVGRL
ncbi:MAG: alkyl hydroperoxide reductase subunit C [Limnochordia bacterium]|jgi:peroxiredoxin|nr:alkyl hydroperoxide reductase subunit C [Limnochordia bacterium]MDI9464058.1 alkyl hydroperoxide reductase subunit C [Bacillota bacterium]NLO94869.1 peroxiredoxin [Bacillota bacterium]HAN95757.1 peroxiredoxin [Bacillota bacterium]HOB40853.1 alkyl hydroperoxide reductase subunit C [Limnochordia bacterium]